MWRDAGTRWGLGGIAVFLGGWELVCQLHLVNPFFIPPFSAVIMALGRLTATGLLPSNLLVSLERALAGFLIAIMLGVPLGLLLGSWFDKLHLVLQPLLDFLAQLNPFILFHLLFFFLKLGEALHITVIAWTCIWPVLYNTSAGVKNIRPGMIKLGRSYGLQGRALFGKVIIPAAAGQICAGIRLSAGYALYMLIAAEMMGAKSGLGWLVMVCQESYRVTELFATVLVIALLGWGLDALIQRGALKLVPTGPDQPEAGLTISGTPKNNWE